ncbi:type II toxin-antitoxin system prevent-host-death family antitoxin [Halomonas sp. BLK-85]
MHANVKQLRLQTKALIAATQRGETVEITFHGKPCARLVGVAPATSEKRSAPNPAFGLWADQGEASAQEIDTQVRGLRAPRTFREAD